MSQRNTDDPTGFHRRGRAMSLALLTYSLERREQAKSGGSRIEARKRLARKIGLLPGTIYNLGHDQLKRLDHAIRERIVQYAIRDIEQEIARLTHELDLCRQMGAAQNSELVAKTEALKAQFEALYSEVTGVRL